MPDEAAGGNAIRMARPRLAEALAVVYDVSVEEARAHINSHGDNALKAAWPALSDAREAWEAMAARGLIPQEWINNEHRAYIVNTVDGSRRAYFPPTPRACISLASDLQSISTVEALALEAVSQMRVRVNAPNRPVKIVWRFDSSKAPPAIQSRTRDALSDLGKSSITEQIVSSGYGVDSCDVEQVTLLAPEL